jgi:predicted lipoprotein with Yx(FWY)xxD motif
VGNRNWIAATLTAGALALAGCGAGGSAGSGAAGSAAVAAPRSPAAGSAAPAGASALLTTWTSPVGAVVVTASGAAVYVFDRDTAGSGTSSCTGTCAENWPPVTTTSATPTVSGVTGAVGTIDRSGTRQVTLGGRPLYTYVGDSAGQTNGQGKQGVWWVVSPAGQAISRTAAPSSSAPSSSAPSSPPDDGGYSY